jgi:hypothetical protein
MLATDASVKVKALANCGAAGIAKQAAQIMLI